MTIIDTTPAAGLNAVDLATPEYPSLTAYSRGWEDAVYQGCYYNPYYVDDTPLAAEYNTGHAAGLRAARCQTADAGQIWE